MVRLRERCGRHRYRLERRLARVVVPTVCGDEPGSPKRAPATGCRQWCRLRSQGCDRAPPPPLQQPMELPREPSIEATADVAQDRSRHDQGSERHTGTLRHHEVVPAHAAVLVDLDDVVDLPQRADSSDVGVSPRGGSPNGEAGGGERARRRQRRSFTPEFKAEVIGLVRPGRSSPSTGRHARSEGARPAALRKARLLRRAGCASLCVQTETPPAAARRRGSTCPITKGRGVRSRGIQRRASNTMAEH